MVSVYKKEKEEEQITFGELVLDDEETFRVHSSSVLFTKAEYQYKKII